MTSTRSSVHVAAQPEAVYRAFVDPGLLLEWLPPAQMTGLIHAFDGRPGGGYVMSLFYPPEQRDFRGKTTEREDRIRVRFVELSPPRRLVETVTFETDDPALQGEMSLTVTLEPLDGGTEVTMVVENLPPGLRPEYNEAGARISLDQLARRFG